MRIIDKGRHPRPFHIYIALVLLVGVCAVAGLGFLRYTFIRDIYYQPKTYLIDAPRAYLTARFNAPDIPVLNINMKYKYYERVLAKRQEAIDFGLLIREESDWVPAEIETDGRTVPVRMRLKGDLTDHLQGDKWSFRIHVRRGDQLFGLRKFSIQHPSTRNYHAESAFLDNLRREGILAPSYRLVRVALNGDDKGVYALEEHFAKELLEAQGRREGPVVKWDETPFWDQRATALRNGVHWSTLDYLNFRSARVNFFGGKRLEENPPLLAMSKTARTLLEGFRDGELTASEVFDVDLTARHLALSKLWGAGHGLLFFNLRYYFNPVSGRLEPIGYDGMPTPWTKQHMWYTHLFGRPDTQWGQLREHDLWVHLLLEDPAMLRAYTRHLHRVSRREYVKEMTDQLAPELEQQTLVLHTEWPDLKLNPLEGLARGRGFVAGMLDPVVSIQARRTGAGIEVSNAAEVPVEVLGVEMGSPFVAVNPPLILRERLQTDVAGWAFLNAVPTLSDSATLRVQFRVLGEEDTVRSVLAQDRRSFDRDRNHIPPAETAAALVSRYPFVTWRPDENRFYLRRGEWTVTGDLSFPLGAGVVAEPGLTLRMEQGAVIVVRGPMLMDGTGDAPITLAPQEETWGGLLLVRAGAPSRWHSVNILATEGVARSGWQLLGGVTVYESPVEFSECVFDGHRGEDALNIMRSTFGLTRCVFRGTASDAFDGDFVEGRVIECVFSDIAGDGIDVSGSQVEIRDVRARNVADKAVSAGEESRVRVVNLTVDDGGIGVASKDRSGVEIEGGGGRNLKIGLAAYTKKSTYGPAWIEAEGFRMDHVADPVLVQTGSLVRLDKIRYEGSELAVKALYEQGVLGN